jgi:hypothetical protein
MTTKVTAEQMRDQIAQVRYAMNSVKGCANDDNIVAEKRHLANDLDVLADMSLTRKNLELTARQTTWIKVGRDLIASTGDVAQVIQHDPETLAACLDTLRKIGM